MVCGLPANLAKAGVTTLEAGGDKMFQLILTLVILDAGNQNV